MDKEINPNNLARKKRRNKQSILAFTFLLSFSQLTQAQCAMCRAVLDSEENVAIAESVNNGIVYLMAIPYILVGVLFYFVYKKMSS
ncbi:hypothetical protein [Aurantibacter crassamenti]|uniref:hypothetical protein n=1 Tax=Aurantibacter crassamenti TaxID=1837375 RepID=UPI001EEE96B5|nr:hypothetical protein [Aurantibacter crassamenti]